MTPRLKSVGHILAVSFFLMSTAAAWQQRVAYDIAVKLDTEQHLLHGTETVWYWNQSPDTLTFVWLLLYPNAYRSRTTTFAKELEQMGNHEFAFASARELGWLRINRLTVLADESGRVQELDIGRGDTSTRLRVDLPGPLAPEDSLRLDIQFDVKIPAFFSRLGRQKRHYCISQWYPKIAVYDLRGWHPYDYHAIGEFYGEFGRFDVAITVPAEMVVGATGELREAAVEYPWMMLDPAKRPKPPNGTLKTLHFHAENVHDFCWVADPGFVLVQDSIQPPRSKSGDGGWVLINVLVRQQNLKGWRDVPEYARKALVHYGAHYGHYPYRQLTVVDGYSGAGGGMEYPNLVIIESRPVPGTRVLEQVVVHEIGHQWFYGMLGSDEMAEAWLDEGINTFATTRYFEETYGKKGNLSNYPRWLDWLPQLDDRYYQQFIYHLTATNDLLKPVLTPANDFVDEPIAYAGVIYSQGSLVIDMLRRIVGDSQFDRVMQVYCQRFQFRHPTTEDFIAVVEEVTGRDLDWFFSQWLRTAGTCDYALGRIHQESDGPVVEIVQKGDIMMPVEVLAVFSNGSRQVLTWEYPVPCDSPPTQGERRATNLRFPSRARLSSVVLDPEGKLLEINRWNNYFPPKAEVRPVFDLPSFDRYQLFYGPFFWWDRFHGVQFGPWLMGRQFVDAGPLHGRHMWSVSGVYSTKIADWEAGGSYTSPLSQISERLKFGASASYSRRVQTRASAEIRYLFGRVFRPPNGELRLSINFHELAGQLDTVWLYHRDWSSGRFGGVELSARGNYARRSWRGDGEIRFLAGSRRLPTGRDFLHDRRLFGDSSYALFSFQTSQTWRPARHLRLRLRFFLGAATAGTPSQERFYLSGSLRPTPAEPISWSYQTDIAGTQEHWHIDGDANLRGFAGLHRKGKYGVAVNLILPFPFVQPFFDIGNVGDSIGAFHPERLRMDAGVRLSTGLLYADFPFWRNELPYFVVSPLDRNFRWAIGFRISGEEIRGGR